MASPGEFTFAAVTVAIFLIPAPLLRLIRKLEEKLMGKHEKAEAVQQTH